MVELNDQLVQMLRSVSPRNAVWLLAAQSMLQYPAGVALLHVARGVEFSSPQLVESHVARIAALSLRGARSWGRAFGVVRACDFVAGDHRVHVIEAFERLAFLVTAASDAPVVPEELGAWLGASVPYAARYSMQWAAAAHVLELERHAVSNRELRVFPKGPTSSMLEALPAAARLEGSRPWRPHTFLKRVLESDAGSPAAVAGRALLHLVMERDASRGQRESWAAVFAVLDVDVGQLSRPSIEEIAPFWRPGLKQLGFDIAREWQRLVGGHVADAATPTPRVRSRRASRGDRP